MKTITVYLEKCHQNTDVTKEMNEWFGQSNSYYALWDRNIKLADTSDASIVLDSSVGVDILKVHAVLSFENLENTDSFLVEDLQFKAKGAEAVSLDKLPFVLVMLIISLCRINGIPFNKKLNPKKANKKRENFGGNKKFSLN